jgi:hypothetical protein
MDLMPRARILRKLAQRGVRIFIYPHAARPNIFWDFPGQVMTDFITAHFVPAEGHAQIMRSFGVPHPIEPVGWHLSETRPFRCRDEVKKILFAPIHPNSNGFLSSIDRDINEAAFRKALSLMLENVSLTVRYLRDLKRQGLWKAGGVEYIEGAPDGSTVEIDRADLVISHQTFAFLAVARGVPTLMMAEDKPPRWGGSEEKLRFVLSWEKYRDLMAFPLDILSGEDLGETVFRAIDSDMYIRDWRERMIGPAFDPDLFVERVESYL